MHAMLVLDTVPAAAGSLRMVAVHMTNDADECLV